ncbi:hypothetical protein ABZW58_14970 [Streptomyces cellulosae]
MRIRITSEGDEYTLTDLQSWLKRDPGTATVPVEPVVGTGPTMGALEALDIVLSNGTSLANFAIAYATWRSTRANGASAGGRNLTHGDSTVDISHLSPEELADLLRRLNGNSSGDDTAA